MSHKFFLAMNTTNEHELFVTIIVIRGFLYELQPVLLPL
jgi:hypothetical protein